MKTWDLVQSSFNLFWKHKRGLQHDILSTHNKYMLTDWSQLTSVLISFCRINCVCRRFPELQEMGCFFPSVRSSTSYTYAWPVFCWAVPSKRGLLPCAWATLSRSVSLAQCAPHCYRVYSIRRDAYVDETCKMCCCKTAVTVASWGPVHEAVLFPPSAGGRASAGVQRKTAGHLRPPHPNRKPPHRSPGSLRDWRWHGWVKEVPIQARGRVQLCVRGSSPCWVGVLVFGKQLGLLESSHPFTFSDAGCTQDTPRSGLETLY